MGRVLLRSRIDTFVERATVATAVLLGVVASVLGALLPALRASSIQPVLAMRARRW